MTVKDLLLIRNIPFEENVSLASKSWIKFGGTVALWIAPTSISQLEEICRYLYANDVTFDLVGQTSNIFFHSTYNPQVVVSTVKVNQYKVEYDMLTCDCGCNVMKLAKEMLAEGYAGFYGLVGLPGTVASAVVNNAGCFNCSISGMLTSADVLMHDGTLKNFSKNDFGYEKRSSRFKRGEVKGIILSAKLRLQKAESIEEEYRKSEETKIYRNTHQEGPAKNLGSVFAKMTLKRKFRTIIARIIAKVVGMSGFKNQKYVFKRMMLTLYGYRDLDKYISDRQINIFVWQDVHAEEKFDRYKQFMNMVFGGLSMEIEERV